MTILDDRANELPDATLAKISNGDLVFKLHSHRDNPIIGPVETGLAYYNEGVYSSGAIFNGGAVEFHDGIIMTPRVHAEYQKGLFFDESLQIKRVGFKNYISKIWILHSKDGIHFERYHLGLIKGDGSDHQDFFYGIEDVRITKINNKYFLIGCGKVSPPFAGLPGRKGDRIAIYSTEDFVNINYHGKISGIDMRNATVFPETISGKLYMLFRFKKDIHIDTVEIGQLNDPSSSNHFKTIYKNREKNVLLKTGVNSHENEKIGPGPPPVRTDKGWLLVYHAVGEIDASINRVYGLGNSKIIRSYSISAALLDIHDPTKVICRTKYPIYVPSNPWELYGDDIHPIDIPSVVYPMGLIVKNGNLLLYCGAGDKYMVLLSAKLDSLIDFLWNECKI